MIYEKQKVESFCIRMVYLMLSREMLVTSLHPCCLQTVFTTHCKLLWTEIMVCAFLYPTPFPPAIDTKRLAQYLAQSKETLQDAKGEQFAHFVSFLPFCISHCLLFISLRKKKRRNLKKKKTSGVKGIFVVPSTFLF